MLNGRTTRTYWSCTKFADWVRGNPHPAVDEGCNSWHKKIRYWLAEDGLDGLQNIINWPMDRLKDTRSYVMNRWIDKTHALTSHLKRGQWHEFDTRLLHSAFDSLVDFVEVEKALDWMAWYDEGKKCRVYRPVFRSSSWRCPTAGIACLEWESHLKCDGEDWRDDPNYGKPTHQALRAQETYALYTWWKEERPKRQDPRRILDLCHKMEQEQTDEDTTMLIRLVKLRSDLWT